MSIMLKCYHKDNSEAVYPDVLCLGKYSWIERWLPKYGMSSWFGLKKLKCNRHLQHPLSMCTINVKSSFVFLKTKEDKGRRIHEKKQFLS
jgi:hypothetical protein